MNNIRPSSRDRIASFDYQFDLLSWDLASFSSLKDRKAFIGVSVKNPRFSRRFFRSVLAVVKQFEMELTVCIVDEPYIHNILATSNTLDDFTSAVTSLNKISREAQSMVSSALSSTKVAASLVNWRSLAASIDLDLKFECERAFYTDKKFRDFVWAEVKRAIPPGARAGDINRFCGFFIQEVPVLADVLFSKRAIDFYPGPGTDLFFMLQKGIFSEALPKLSQLARSCTGMGYVEATKDDVGPDSSGQT